MPRKPAASTAERKHGPEGGAHRRGFGRIVRKASGRYSAAYIGPDKDLHRSPVTFALKLDAEAWLVAERQLLTAGTWVAPKLRRTLAEADRIDLDTYATDWLKDRTLKPRTRAHYQQLLDRHILPDLGALELKTITPTIVRNWHAGMGKHTPTQRAHAYGLLRTIMNTAVSEDLVKANPCRVRGAGNAPRAKTIRPATLDELATIVEHVPPRCRLAVLLSAWCALRFGELIELRRRDVDLTNGVIRVRRAVTRVDGKIIVATPKSAAGVRDVAIPPHLVPVIRDHLAEHAQWGRDGLLFPSTTGAQWNQSSTTRWFYPARAAAGRPDLRWHDLRHTGAVLAASTGATLAELMARLGHSTAGAAMRYQHAASDRDQAIAAELSRIASAAETAAAREA